MNGFMEINELLSSINSDQIQALSSPKASPSDEAENQKLQQLTDGIQEDTYKSSSKTRYGFNHEQWSTISSQNENQNEVSKECSISTGQPPEINTPQKLSNSNENDSNLSLLHAYSLPNTFRRNAFTIPFCNISSLEDNDTQETNSSCESDQSSLSHVEEFIFPSLAGHADSTAQEIKKSENKQRDLKHQFQEPNKSYLLPELPASFQKCEDSVDATKQIVSHSETINTSAKGSARRYMGANFQPSNWDVIFGRGKDAYDHIGNRRFKIIVAMHLRDYADSKNQVEKAHLVDRIVNQIREASPKAGFVKKDAKGKWYKIDTGTVQQKVARTFRDSMIGLLRCNSKLSDYEKSKNAIEAQNAIFRSCQIRFST